MKDKVNQSVIEVYHFDTPEVSENGCSILFYGKNTKGSYVRVRVKMNRSMFCFFVRRGCKVIVSKFQDILTASLEEVGSLFHNDWLELKTRGSSGNVHIQPINRW